MIHAQKERETVFRESPDVTLSRQTLKISYCRYVWACLIAQSVKNLPAMQETWVQFLGWEDPLEKEMAIHSSMFKEQKENNIPK